MKKTILVILISLLVLGIILGFLVNKLGFSRSGVCTKIGCICQEGTYEFPCNTCFDEHVIFFSGVLNFVKSCQYKELVICKDGKEEGYRYDFESKQCRYKFSYFGL